MGLAPSDLFKFVALRSVQRAPDEATRMMVITDGRPTDRASEATLSELTRRISSPAAALRHWAQLDLDRLRPLASAQQSMREVYRQVAIDD
ncbi:MAG TPA: hypothetical protein VFY45_23675, partial [Baekduia sp.]|nr:hypothetical protein [Baekduia sp.]